MQGLAPEYCSRANMENANQLFQAGRLKEAVQALSAEVRDHPSDTKRRTFLFELLCFSGEYDRAEKQLDVLAEAGPNSEIGALLYRSALQAERTRQDLFQKKEKPSAGTSSGAETITGTLNGKPFQTITDADPRIGPRLEVFAAGNYLWLNFEHLASIQIPPATPASRPDLDSCRGSGWTCPEKHRAWGGLVAGLVPIRVATFG